MSIRKRIARWICPDLARTEEAYDMCVKVARRRLDAATPEDNAACAAKHASGSYGWLTMKRMAPMTAYDFLVDTREGMLRKRADEARCSDKGQPTPALDPQADSASSRLRQEEYRRRPTSPYFSPL